MILSKVYEDAEHRLERNEITLGEFERLVDIEVIEPKRGEWICHEGRWIDFDYYPTKYECNQCHHYVDVASDKNFCPNCGADMRKEGE